MEFRMHLLRHTKMEKELLDAFAPESPKEWNKSDDFIGEFILTSDRKWIKK